MVHSPISVAVEQDVVVDLFLHYAVVLIHMAVGAAAGWGSGTNLHLSSRLIDVVVAVVLSAPCSMSQVERIVMIIDTRLSFASSSSTDDIISHQP